MAEIVSAGPFATEGERRAAERLRELPDQWLVVCNKMLATNDGRTYEIDFIVVGERWVFVIDEKSWWGKITGNDQRWVRADNYSERSPLSKADTITRPLAGHLRAGTTQLRNNIGQWARGGVLLSLSEQVPDIQDPRAADGIFLLTNVCQRLQDIDRRGGSRDVGRGRDQIKHCLLGLPARPAVPSSIGLYRIDEVVSERGGIRVFHATLDDADARLLYVYDLGRDVIEPTRLREFYMREFGALQQLRQTGLVPEVLDPFPWSDEFIVVPVTPPSGKPLGAQALPETREDFIHELQLASVAFAGLERIHEHGIVHRALGPESIYVTRGGQHPEVIFSNFFAAHVEDHRTIVLSLDALTIDDPYAAPELIAGYGNATPASDAFSLALVFVERMSGVPVTELRQSADGTVVVPNLVARWPSLPEDVLTELTDVFTALVSKLGADRMRVAAAAAAFGDLARRLLVDAQVERRGVLDNRYTVLRLLGQGAMARTYLAKDDEFGGVFALKQFLRPSLVYEQARAEFTALRELTNRHLPRVYDVYPPQNDAHVKMEYIPGPTLDDVRGEFPWDVERWWTLAQDLLSAVSALEAHQLLHRDIKPPNIILHERDGHAVLIDFGLAVPQGEVIRPAGTPLYLPPEAILASEPPATCDRYATAVVLFNALTGMMPFNVNSSTGSRIVTMSTTIQDGKTLRLAQVLLRALASDPAQRPMSADSMRAELQAAMLAVEEADDVQQQPELVNPWVDKLRGLYRNSGVGNADNRGLDSDFVRDTYVPTRLDDQLLPQIFEARPSAVFLSGNPGDGKTAFLEQVQLELERRGGTKIQGDASGWEWNLNGHVYRSCYDASEANRGLSADEQLIEKLTGLDGATASQPALTVLVAINDGRLADFFARHRERFPWLARQVEQTQQRTPARASTLWLIDLKRRAFVVLPSDADRSVASKVLERLISPDNWVLCNGCAAHAVCPIRTNSVALGQPDIEQRLEYLLLLSHLRRQRHTTMRDLRSAFAYLITANSSCNDIHRARHGDHVAPALVDLAYWRSAFAPLDTGDEFLGDLGQIDPARFPQPPLDRFLHFHRSESDATDRRILFADQEDLSPQRFATEADWRSAMKRRLYFAAMEPSVDTPNAATLSVHWKELLPYRHADEFLELLAGSGDADETLEKIARGIFCSDGYANLTSSGQLNLRVAASREQQLVVLKQFPLAEFRLQIQHQRSSETVEAIPEGLVLEHASGTPRLEITLDLFELLMRLADGLQPEAPEFQPLLEDLAAFKSALLLRQTTDLVLLDGQRREHVLTQRDGKIVRLPRASE